VIGLISEDDVLAKEADPGRRSRLFGRFRRRTGLSKAAGTTATELMSSPAVTVTRSTSAREAARAMFRHRVHQLPVVDAVSGRLTGIVTRSDLLAVYERPAEDIHREVLYDLIGDALAMDPGRFTVDVDHGTVTLRGEFEDRCAARVLTDAVRHVDGVVTVIDELTCRHGGDPAGRSPADP
jgi:CBS domain-containing protein